MIICLSASKAAYRQNSIFLSQVLGPSFNFVLTRKDDEAEPLYRRALEIREAQLGPDHPGVAQSLNNLAELLRDQAKDDEAEPLHRRALAIREAQLGPDHPDVANSLNSLASLLVAQAKDDEAEPLYRRALEICETQLGPDHPNTQTTRRNLELLLEKMQSTSK